MSTSYLRMLQTVMSKDQSSNPLVEGLPKSAIEDVEAFAKRHHAELVEKHGKGFMTLVNMTLQSRLIIEVLQRHPLYVMFELDGTADFLTKTLVGMVSQAMPIALAMDGGRRERILGDDVVQVGKELEESLNDYVKIKRVQHGLPPKPASKQESKAS